MKKNSIYEDISIFLVKHSFHLRFFIAKQTKKSEKFRKIIEKLLFEDDEIIIIPNTMNLNKNKKVENKIKLKSNIEVNQSFNNTTSEFLPTEILKLAVKQAKDIVIMKQCLCRISNDCKNYPQDLGCIFMGPATHRIPEKYAYKASVEDALKHIDKADKAGLSHLIGRNKIDTIWMNIGPKEELLTVCHCCSCCCLWKVHPDIDNKISEKIEKLKGIEVELDLKKCQNCGKCLKEVCFTKAIELKDNKPYINQEKCKGCGRCTNICKYDAISINYTKNTINNVLKRIDNLVDYKS